MTEFFTAVGAFVIIAMIVAIIFAMICAIRQFIRERIWIHKYNHRFDKPPTAKCYCKDCYFYGDFGNRCLCRKHKSYFSEDYFCKDADPCKAESGLAREKTRLKWRSIADLKAIPLVRCIDCSHCYFADNRVPDERGWVCDKNPTEPVNLNGFCSDGKRR